MAESNSPSNSHSSAEETERLLRISGLEDQEIVPQSTFQQPPPPSSSSSNGGFSSSFWINEYSSSIWSYSDTSTSFQSLSPSLILEDSWRKEEKLNLDGEYVTPQKPIASPSSNFSYSAHQNNFLQNRDSINGCFPSLSPSLSWNTGSNAVDWLDYDTSSKFLDPPDTLPAIKNRKSLAIINSSVSIPPASFIAQCSKKKEAYNQEKTAEFINYLKLKGWSVEEIQELEQSNDPRFLFGYYGIDIQRTCMNLLGSMYLQRVIMTATPDLTEIILDAVMEGVFEVMIDRNGSFVFRKLLDYCSQEQLSKIVSKLTNRDVSEVFINAVMTESGAKSIQKLISKLKFLKPLMKTLMESLPGGFPSLSPSLSWNNGSNAVDWLDYDISSKFHDPPYTSPATKTRQGFARINNSVSPPPASFKAQYSRTKEAYNQEFVNYLKLKGWTEEEIRELEQSNDPRFLLGCYGLDIHMMCLSQLGAMYLHRILHFQKLLQSQSTGLADTITNAILKGIFQVMRDGNGRSVFLKLLENCREEQFQKLICALNGKGSKVYMDMLLSENGFACMYKLIAKLKADRPQMVNMLLHSLRSEDLLVLMINRPSRFLIELCMEVPPDDQVQSIYESVVQNYLELARHKEGSHVLKRSLETIQDPLRMLLLTSIAEQAVHLSEDRYGNFVMQKVVELENPDILPILHNAMQGKIVLLSTTDYSTHFVQACLKTSAVGFIVKEILLDSKELVKVALDRFGNYVLQKALENLKDKPHHSELYMNLVSAIKEVSGSLRNQQYGRNILKCMNILLKTPSS